MVKEKPILIMQASTFTTKTITLPSDRQEEWQKALPRLINESKESLIDLDCGDLNLNYRDFKKISDFFERSSLNISNIRSNIPSVVISASALGLRAELNVEENVSRTSNSTDALNSFEDGSELLFREGTLRSGEQLESNGDLLLLGDVNPGATVSADGDVMVWGRLRGIAHAGKSGNIKARIVSLQLRPLQLRIANQVARGPEDKPEDGLAEEALIKSNRIIIQPARPFSRRLENPFL